VIPTPASLLTPWSAMTATAGLIAFHIGLYSLVGRERKSPYVINAVFPVFLLCLVAATLALLSLLVPESISEGVLYFSLAVLTFAFALSIIVVYRTVVRFVYFVDTVGFRHLPGIRQWRRRRTLNSARPTFSHSTMSLDAELQAEVIQILSQMTGRDLADMSAAQQLQCVALLVSDQTKVNQVLTRLCAAFLTRQCCVQYLTASRHPIDFVVQLNAAAPDQNAWRGWAKNLIVIDAYSSHFAFIDSIYTKKDRELAGLDVKQVTAKMTFAGIHTASSQAFNLFQTTPGDNVRRPTLVIYEGTYALTDLESVEQYRIFVRHVIPSEKLWGGMLTVFLEGPQNPADWNLLKAYANIAAEIA
jgi:hypothetical protein